MFVPKLLGEGEFLPADILLQVSDVKMPNLVPELVDGEWRNQLKLAAEQGYELWDSECYSLSDCAIENGGMVLSVNLVDYTYVRGTASSIACGELGASYASLQMFSSLIIRTADDMYLFGIGAKESYVGKLKFIGGIYSKPENILIDGSSLFQSALNELEEEINLSPRHVKSMVLKRIYATEKGLRDLCFTVDLNIDSAEASRLFADRQDDEMSGLLVITPEEARREIASLPDYKREKADLVEIP